jgi:predicted aspartyl protease
VDVSRTIPPEAFAPPRLPSDFGVDDASGIASVPFLPVRYHGHELPLIVVAARVNSGPPMRFLLDTGGANVLTSTAAQQLHLRRQGALGVGGTGAGTMYATLANVDSLTIGTAHVRRQSFMILPLEGMLPGIDGIVGAELLARFSARIDYRQRRLSLAPEAPQSWLDGAIVSRIAFDKDMPDIGGSIDAVPGRFTLDTGSVGGLDINAPFAAANNLYARYHAGSSNGHSTGIGGEIETTRIRVDRMRLGTLAITDVPATLAYKGGGVTDDPTVAGNVGEKIFTRFGVVVFDYRRQSLAVQR